MAMNQILLHGGLYLTALAFLVFNSDELGTKNPFFLADIETNVVKKDTSKRLTFAYDDVKRKINLHNSICYVRMLLSKQ